jgi:hypothetical protein
LSEIRGSGAAVAGLGLRGLAATIRIRFLPLAASGLAPAAHATSSRSGNVCGALPNSEWRDCHTQPGTSGPPAIASWTGSGWSGGVREAESGWLTSPVSGRSARD